MRYNNYDDRNRGRGRNDYFDNSRRNDRDFNDRDYDRGGYDDRGREMDRPYQINQPVRHKATGIKLIVIRYGREQVECRKPDLSSDYFYLYELEPINDGQN